MARVLVVDDDTTVRESVSMTLRYARHEAHLAAEAREALDIIENDEGIDVVLCDVKMPRMDGIELLGEIKKLKPHLPVIMISGHGTVETAVEATKLGAFDFIEQPLDQDRLLVAVRNAVQSGTLTNEARYLRENLLEKWRIIGDSPQMRELKTTIERIAPTDARVLITGENGSGKELVARNLHALSSRAGAAFVDVNCAAIPKELIESELFGHEKGSFTGATARKTGKFEQAHRGTLFLDEIGDMDLAAQAKVLRALETGEIQRVGATATVSVDVRVIAATNKDLDQDVAEGRFREDLLYRLNVIPLQLPPLRERPEDLPALLARFLDEFCSKYDIEKKVFTAEAIDQLKRLHWAGNVRELRNFVERAILMSAEREIDVDSIDRLTGQASKLFSESIFSCPTYEEFKQTSERLFFQKKLEENGWNIKRTAEALGMQRSNLYKKIDRYNLK